MSSGFELPLAPAETLGRRFQYAFLSLDPDLAIVDEAQDRVLFKRISDYLDLVNKALNLIKQLTVSKANIGKHSNVIVRGINCDELHEGPRLYRAGAGDYTLLEKEAKFTNCPYTNPRGRRKRKTKVAWIHAAVSYADQVLSQGSLLGRKVDDLPWLAKATVFGKMRTVGGGQVFREKLEASKLTLDTLGSILLGGSISFLWSQRLGDSTVEFYLVPNTVHKGYANLRNIMLARGFSKGSVARAVRLVSDYPVSLEVALALTLAQDLASSLGPASQISSYMDAAELEKAATLMTVTPQQRPMVTSVIPLSIAVYAAYSDKTLKVVSYAGYSASMVLKQIPGLRDVIGSCVGSMYLQAVNCRWSDHLSLCIRNLYTMADKAARDGYGDLAATLERLASRLSKDYLAMARRC